MVSAAILINFLRLSF